MNETDFDNLHTALAEVFKYIKYSGDKQVLKNVIKSDKVFSELDRETADLINDVTGSDLIFKDRKVIDMCIAHEEMKKEAIEENSLKIAGTLLMMGKISIDEIAMATDLPVEVIKDLADQQV